MKAWSSAAGLEFLLARDGLPDWLNNRRRLDDVYLGRDYGAEIDRILGNHADVRRLDGAPAETTVKLINQGRAGAIFEGRMEFGPRALGARSIIASPIDAAVNQRMNTRLNRTDSCPSRPTCWPKTPTRCSAFRRRTATPAAS